MLPVGEDRRKSDMVDVELLSDIRGYRLAIKIEETIFFFFFFGNFQFHIKLEKGIILLTRSIGPGTSAGLDFV